MIKYVQTCDVCQRNKIENIPYPRLLQPLPLPRQAWTHVTIDFIEKVSKSQGFDTILVVIDRLTKYGQFIALAHLF